MIPALKEAIPYRWRKSLLDVITPGRPGIGPVLGGMPRELRTVFDIGANVGDISCLMLHYFPAATVYSFEPCTDTYGKMVKTIGSSGYAERSRPFKLGFFDEEKESTLNITSFHGANSMLDITPEYRQMHPHIDVIQNEQISLVRLDDFVRTHGISHIDLVKIDVEGVEQNVLRGGADTFSTKVDAVILEISFLRAPRQSAEFITLFQLMHDFGFFPAEIYDVSHGGKKTGGLNLIQFDCIFRRFRPM